MGTFLGAIGLVIGIIGGLIWLIYAFIKHHNKKGPALLIVAGLFLTIAGISLTPDTHRSTDKKVEQSSKKASSSSTQSNPNAISEFNTFVDTNPSFNEFTRKFYSYSLSDQTSIWDKVLYNHIMNINVTFINSGQRKSYFIQNDKFHGQKDMNSITNADKPYAIYVRDVPGQLTNGQHYNLKVKLVSRGVIKNSLNYNWDAEYVNQ